MENMEENEMQCIQNYHEVISNKYPHEAPNPEYNFIVNNISSFGKDSNNSNEDSPLQKSPKKIQKQNRVVNFIINTNSIFDNIQCQNMEIYSDFNKNIENKEEKIENNLNENIEQINTLKENNEISDSNNSNEYKTGRWSKEEHEKFIEGILKYGNEWRKVQKIIKSRSSTQARSHAQKFFLKLKKEIKPDILSDSDKLLDLIISSCDKPRNSLKLSQEQKEKLMSVIRSNLKAEENCNKSGKEGLSLLNNSLNLNEKEESNFDDINEEEDNLAYNKNEVPDCQKKMSFDSNEIKRKVTFCSKKRKSSSDISCLSNYNKIFNITKEASHKNSLDLSKINSGSNININNNNNINYNVNLMSKITAEKNNSNNGNKIIKFSVKNDENNHNFSKNHKNINNKNNFYQKENKQNESSEKNNIQIKKNYIINNNVINIFPINIGHQNNTINNINNINNIQNVYNPQFAKNYKSASNEFMKNNKFKTSIVQNIQTIQNTNMKNTSPTETEKNNSNLVLNNENFFPVSKGNETCQDPFHLQFFNFDDGVATNDARKKDNIFYNNNNHVGDLNDVGHSLSECSNFYNNNNNNNCIFFS